MNYITFGIVLSMSVICDGSCLSGTRRVILRDGSEDCVFCKECPTDHVVARVCSEQGDTVCCPLNTYLPPTESEQGCFNCSVCPAGQYVSRQCSLTENVECTDCPNGTFTDDSNYLTCINCTEDCEHGVQANCSQTSDTKCKDDRPADKQYSASHIVVICVVLVLMVLCVTISVAIYCRRRRTSNHKEKELKHRETDIPLMTVDGNKEEQSDSITPNITTTDVGDDTVVINLNGEPECKTVETHQQNKPEIKDSHFTNQPENVNADINIVRKETPKGSVTTTKGGGETTAPEIYENPSIGMLYDTVARRKWAVFRIGKSFVMTSIDAYKCMRVVRNGKLGSKIDKAHVQFASSKFGIEVLTTEGFVNDKLGVYIMKLSDDIPLPPPLRFDTSTIQQCEEFQIDRPIDNLMIKRIHAKLSRINKGNIESIRRFYQKHESEISPLRDEYCKVRTITKETTDILDTNVLEYEDSFYISGTNCGMPPGSPVCLKSPGQKSTVVGIYTRTIPWVFQYVENDGKVFPKDDVYHLCTPLSDIKSLMDKQLWKKIFES